MKPGDVWEMAVDAITQYAVEAGKEPGVIYLSQRFANAIARTFVRDDMILVRFRGLPVVTVSAMDFVAVGPEPITWKREAPWDLE